MTTSVGRRNPTGRMTPSNNNNKMISPSLMLLFVVACCVSGAMSQRTVGDDRPLRFQSFPANPPQSFQQINFFGPLSPQQSGSADPSAVAGSTPNNRQALFFSSQNSGQQDSRNPIFDSRAISPLSTLASSSIGSVQRGQQIRNPTLESGFNPQRQLPSEVAANAFPSVNSGAARLTPASTSIQQGQQQRQKPIVQFQFNRDQVQPMNPAGNFNRLQHPELKLQLLPEIQDFPLPVPIGFRTPFFHQTPPTEVKPLTEGPKPQEPIIEEPLPPSQESPQETIEESLPAPVVQEIPDVPPSQIETNEFQRVRPVQQTESLLNFEPASTPRPSQLQVLSDQPEESNNRDSQTNRRNRLRRPLNSDTPATELPNSPRRVPPVRESNPNLRPVLVDDTPVPTTGSVRQRFRSTTIAAPLTTTEAEEQQAVTIRTRTPFLRPRPTNPTISRTRPNVRLFTTTPQTEEEITTRAPATTNRFFGGRRPIRPTAAVEEEEPATEILITTTQRIPTTTTAGRVRSNFRFNSPEQAGTTTVKSVRFNSPEQSQTVQSPVLPVVQADVDTLVNSVNDNNNGPSSVDQQQETPTELISKPEEEATDVTTIEPEVEYYYDDVVDEEVDVQLTNDSQSSTTVATIPSEIPSSAAPPQEISVETVEIPAPIEITESIATAVEQPVVENDHKPIIDEPIIQHEQVTDVAQPPLPIDEPTAVIQTEEVEGPTTDIEQIVVEEEQAPTSSIATPQNNNNNNGPSKLKIFNLGRRNTSSVNLDNIVFVPNLDGFVLPTNPVTPNTISVETSRSVTVVKMSVDQLPTESPSLLPAGDRQSKAIASKTDNLANSEVTDGKQPPIKEAEQAGESLLPEPTTKVPENRNDELDLIQSDLFDKHLNNNFNMEANKAASNTSTTTTATPPTSSRTPFRPAFKRPFDLLPTTTAIPVTEQVVAASSSTTTTTEVAAVSSTTTESSVATTIAAEVTTLSLFDRLFGKKVVVMDDISSLLPPGFSPPKEEEVLTEAPVTKMVAPVTEPAAPVTEVTPKEAVAPEAEVPVGPPVNPLDNIFGSVKVDDVSAFLPPGFKMDQPPTTESPTTTTAKNPFAGLFDTANMDDLSGLLPSNFKNHLFTPSPSKTTATSTVTESSSSVVAESSTASPSSEPSTTTAKKGLVFPTRASPARTTTSEKPKVKPTQPGVEIKSGWPVRATTEFTGWPSPPTQPYTPPSTTTTTARTTTTTTRTTTTTTPRVTTVGQCGEECRLAGTIRLVDGIDWMPELSDHNTREWYQLAAIVENSLDAVYQSGPLAPWYAGIVVEAFSRGSVLVDYYLNLNGTTILDTGEIRNYFHMSLDKEGESYKLGNYTVDTKSTDFIVLRQPVVSGEKQRVVTGGVGEWVIAVIVVGLASLIFVIAFGTTMLIRRRRQHQRKPLPLTEEMLNELNKNHMSCADNTGTDSFYNDEVGDAWDHRTNFPTKPIKPLPRPASVSAIHQSNRTHGSSGGASYNYNHYTNYNNFRPQLHDSWKSEWDSSYYDTSNSGTAPRSSKTAPTRPATSYGRYPTYGRSRPSNFHDDF